MLREIMPGTWDENLSQMRADGQSPSLAPGATHVLNFENTVFSSQPDIQVH